MFELFDFRSETQITPVSITVEASDEIWVCVSNYSSGSWYTRRVLAPFPVALDLQNSWVSPGGSFYVTVVATKAALDVSSIMVSTSSELPNGGLDEIEDNDNELSPNPLPELPFSGFQGHLGAGGYDGDNVDYFTFPAVEAQQVDIAVDYEAAAANLKLELLQPGSANVLAEDSAGNSGSRHIVLGLKAGIYVLRVSQVSGAAVYSISIASSTPAYDEMEDNDTLAEAGPLSADPLSSYSGHVGTAGYDGDALDYFVLDAAKAERVSATVDYQAASGNVALALLGSGGLLLSSDEAGNPGARSLTLSLHAGLNYIRVSALSGGSPYTLELTRQSGAYDETEDNDSIAASNPLPELPLSNWSGSAGPEGYDGDGVDYFSLPTADGDLVTVTLSYAEASGNLGLRFSNPDQSSAYFDSAGNPGSRSFTWGAHAGTSYISVERLSGASDYSLDVSIVASGLDETEDNDSFAEANLLPALPVSGWSGNAGSPGYDGDDKDYFFLLTSDRDLVTITLTYDNSQANLALRFSNPDQSTAYFDSSGNPGSRSFSWGAHGGSSYISVERLSGASNYLLDVSVSQPGYGELEDNDTVNTAQLLPAVPLSAFLGSLGPFGYDGDSVDYFKFTSLDGELFDFTLNYDEADGNVTLALLRSSGQQIYLDNAGNPGLRNFQWAFKPGTYILKVTGDGSPVDYTLDVSKSTPGYGETEDNDILDDAYEPEVPFAGLLGHVGQFGYDGDTQDYMLYNAGTGDVATFDLTYDSISGNLAMYLLDALGTIVDEDSAGNPGTRSVGGNLTNQSYYVLVTAVSGYSEYTMDGNVTSP